MTTAFASSASCSRATGGRAGDDDGVPDHPQRRAGDSSWREDYIVKEASLAPILERVLELRQRANSARKRTARPM